MGYITKSELDNITEYRKKHFSKGLSAPAILEAYNPNQKYDIFLSHSYLDKESIASLKILLEDYGYSVYVDWISDADLNRNSVNKQTAERVRNRMKNCQSLLYAISNNSPTSKWMPWELGYFDGINGFIAIIPITQNSEEKVKGIEYLHLYPVVKEYKIKHSNEKKLWIIDKDYTNVYSLMDDWIYKSIKPFAHNLIRIKDGRKN